MTATAIEKLSKLGEVLQGVVSELTPRSATAIGDTYCGECRGRFSSDVEERIKHWGGSESVIEEQEFPMGKPGTFGTLKLTFADGFERLVKVPKAEIQNRRKGIAPNRETKTANTLGSDMLKEFQPSYNSPDLGLISMAAFNLNRMASKGTNAEAYYADALEGGPMRCRLRVEPLLEKHPFPSGSNEWEKVGHLRKLIASNLPPKIEAPAAKIMNANKQQISELEAAGKFEEAYALLPASEKADFPTAQNYSAFRRGQLRGAIRYIPRNSQPENCIGKAGDIDTSKRSGFCEYCESEWKKESVRREFMDFGSFCAFVRSTKAGREFFSIWPGLAA